MGQISGSELSILQGYRTRGEKGRQSRKHEMESAKAKGNKTAKSCLVCFRVFVFRTFVIAFCYTAAPFPRSWRRLQCPLHEVERQPIGVAAEAAVAGAGVEHHLE